MSDVALALAQRRTDPMSDAEVTRNAKGDWQIKVSVSDPDVKKAGRLAELEAKRLARVFKYEYGERA